MKKLFIIIALMAISCSKDEPCQKITEKGFNSVIGSFIKLQDGTIVPVKQLAPYKVGDAYCK